MTWRWFRSGGSSVLSAHRQCLCKCTARSFFFYQSPFSLKCRTLSCLLRYFCVLLCSVLFDASLSKFALTSPCSRLLASLSRDRPKPLFSWAGNVVQQDERPSATHLEARLTQPCFYISVLTWKRFTRAPESRNCSDWNVFSIKLVCTSLHCLPCVCERTVGWVILCRYSK